MKHPELERLENLLNEVENQIAEIDTNELQERVLNIEDDINHNLDICHESEFGLFKKLLNRVNVIKNENDFYDEEAELDMMFPDRHDEDFDTDSIS